MRSESHLVEKVAKEHHLLTSACHWFPALSCFWGAVPGLYPPFGTALSGRQSDLSHGPRRNHRRGGEHNPAAQKSTIEYWLDDLTLEKKVESYTSHINLYKLFVQLHQFWKHFSGDFSVLNDNFGISWMLQGFNVQRVWFQPQSRCWDAWNQSFEQRLVWKKSTEKNNKHTPTCIWLYDDMIILLYIDMHMCIREAM